MCYQKIKNENKKKSNVDCFIRNHFTIKSPTASRCGAASITQGEPRIEKETRESSTERNIKGEKGTGGRREEGREVKMEKEKRM